MVGPFPHYIITRFSVRAPGDVQRYRHPEWLEERLTLLGRFGAPSLLSQTSHNFTWLIFADIASPQWVRDGLSEISSGIPVSQFFVEPKQWKSALNDFLQGERGQGVPLITSRLDSDDLLHRDFVQEIAAAAVPEVVLNMPTGFRLRVNDMHLFRVGHKRAFESLCTASPQHIFDFQHGKAADVFPSVEVRPREGMWIQTVHDHNIANASTRGYPCARADGFDMLADAIVRPELRDRIYGLVLSRGVATRHLVRAARHSIIPKRQSSSMMPGVVMDSNSTLTSEGAFSGRSRGQRRLWPRPPRSSRA
jgi:hypothetical protein